MYKLLPLRIMTFVHQALGPRFRVRVRVGVKSMAPLLIVFFFRYIFSSQSGLRQHSIRRVVV